MTKVRGVLDVGGRLYAVCRAGADDVESIVRLLTDDVMGTSRYYMRQ